MGGICILISYGGDVGGICVLIGHGGDVGGICVLIGVRFKDAVKFICDMIYPGMILILYVM